MDEYLGHFVKETTFYNQIVLGSLLPEKLWTPLPHFVQGWLRNYIAINLLYFIPGFLWSFYIYNIKRNVYFPEDAIPTRKTMLLQMYVAMKAMPWYTALFAISDYMVVNGWTRCFPHISDVGWVSYACYSGLGFIYVELGIYWIHRALHDIKPLYKYIHAPHHIFNKQNTLSPFAGLAFHPIEGVLEALPHVMVLFLVPQHFTSHNVVILMDLIWTTIIHDSIHRNLWPVMGSWHHTIHHTKYHYNYGHYTIFMDQMFGTHLDPLKDKALKR